MRFLAAVLGWVAVFALVYAAAMRLIDPRGQFGTHIFPTVTLDARSDKMALFRAYEARGPVQGLVLGSSRSMKIDPAALSRDSGLRFFNFTVDVARAEDYLALYRWTRAQGAPLKRVLIGLDVEALHNDDVPIANLEHNPALMRALRGPRGGPLGPLADAAATVRRYQSTFETSYFRDALGSALTYFAHAQRGAPFMRFAADGYLHYPRWEAERTRGTFDLSREIKACLPGYVSTYRDMTDLSVRRRGDLEALLREARADGVQVTLWITPLHPATAELLGAKTRYPEMLLRTRAYVAQLQRRYGVQVRDYSAPALYGGTPSGWYDCAHVDEHDALRIARGLGEANGF